MTTFITIIYVFVALFMVLAILLQAGKGGGLGAALGGGASQTVFGGGGGADFMAKLTQGFAASFMICAMYLAYASAHSGSDFLQRKSEELEDASRLVASDDEVDYERVGPNPMRLPTPEDAAQMREAAGAAAPAVEEEAYAEPAKVPADEEVPAEQEAPADEEVPAEQEAPAPTKAPVPADDEQPAPADDPAPDDE